MRKREINKQAVGDRIKSIRLSYGWTLKQLSNEISLLLLDDKPIAEGIISRWENGISLPNRERMKAISMLGNMTVEELLYGDFDEFFENLIDKLKEKLINDNISNELLGYIIFNIRVLYSQKNGSRNWDWSNFHSFEQLEKEFEIDSQQIILQCQKPNSRDIIAITTFKNRITDALHEFVRLYEPSLVIQDLEQHSKEKTEFNNLVKMNIDLKIEIENKSSIFINEIDEILSTLITNNNQYNNNQ